MVGAVVEGHGEESVVRVVLGWLGVKFRSAVFRAEGVNDLLERARELADLHLSRGATHVLFFLDADAPSAAGRDAELRGRLSARPAEGRAEAGVFEFIPVQELESWLLSDDSAISRVLGAKVDQVGQPNLEQAGAVKRLEDIFRAARNQYRKSQHAKEIADAASDKAWQRCPSYRRSTGPLRK
jgi:Domain of unknown function (DUF4276)